MTANTEKIFREFVGQEALGEMKKPSFTRDASSNSGFDSLKSQLAQLDQDCQQMKRAVTSRFDAVAFSIEEKLRHRAAALAQSESTPAAAASVTAATPEPTVTPAPVANERETLHVESPAKSRDRTKESLA